LEAILAARRCRERDLVVALMAQRLLDPCSKLATIRAWHSTTFAQELGVTEATEDDLYQAMDWLQGRQLRFEPKLAEPTWGKAAWFFYDVSRS